MDVPRLFDRYIVTTWKCDVKIFDIISWRKKIQWIASWSLAPKSRIQNWLWGNNLGVARIIHEEIEVNGLSWIMEETETLVQEFD